MFFYFHERHFWFRRECEPYMYQAYADKKVAEEVLGNLRDDRMTDYWMQKVVFLD